MRVLIVSQYFWPESFGINEIASALVDKDVDVDVLTAKPNYPGGKIFNGYAAWGTRLECWKNIKIFRVPIFPRGKGAGWRLAANYGSFVLSASIIGPWILRNRRYDVIFVYGVSPIIKAVPAILIAWLRRRPVILWIQDLWPDSLSATGYVTNLRILSIVKKVVRWVYLRSDLLLIQSRAFRENISPIAGDTPIKYYPNSAPPIFSKSVLTEVDFKKAENSSGGFTIVFAGNLGFAQGLEIILDAADLISDKAEIRFLIFGSGSRLEWMKEEAQRRGLINLCFMGRLSKKEMPRALQNAGALLVTLRDEKIFADTIPSKVQAYLASGRPILGSLNGEGARLIHEAKAGLAVPAGNAHLLSKAVLKLSNMSQAERDQMGSNGKLFYERHFDHGKLVDELLVHFLDVAEKRRSK